MRPAGLARRHLLQSAILGRVTPTREATQTTGRFPSRRRIRTAARAGARGHATISAGSARPSYARPAERSATAPADAELALMDPGCAEGAAVGHATSVPAASRRRVHGSEGGTRRSGPACASARTDPLLFLGSRRGAGSCAGSPGSTNSRFLSGRRHVSLTCRTRCCSARRRWMSVG
jgi:hypothetical protein